jgi:uncharacterized protein
MATRSGLVVGVHELLAHPGSRRELRFQQVVEGLRNQLVRVEPSDPVRFELVLEALEDGAVLVRGAMYGRWVMTCRRCLEEVGAGFRVSVAEVYRRPGAGPWEEGYAVSASQTIDLGPLVRDNVVLAMPLYPLCREDCAGLCPSCGANRNEGPCACPPPAREQGWAAALRGLLPREP